MPLAQANEYFTHLQQQVDWQHDEVMMFGKVITTRRKVAWYADPGFAYSYSNRCKEAKPWIPVILKLKKMAETLTNEHFNGCLLNLYHDGHEGMGWHSDAEKTLKPDAAIVSLSFGAKRKFVFKHKKNQEKVSQELEHGSCLVMKGCTQQHWWHCLPPKRSVHSARINLTFRCANRSVL